MTPAEARAAFLWHLVAPWDIYDAIRRVPPGERGALTRAAARHLGVSERTVQRRVARWWPARREPQEPGGLHRVRCPGPAECICDEVILI
jgi:hypothetical protein